MPADRFLHQRAGHSHKVSMLTDLEYRVWTQYLLSADDFGVMRATAVKLQADNDHLANRPARVIVRCIEALVTCGLLLAFDHQAHRFVYQADWQDWQKVTWPAKTINPMPPIETLSEATTLLFSVHPGAKKVPGKNFGSTSEVLQENSQRTSEELSSSRARVPAKRLMANGNGSGLTADGPPLDVAFRAFQDAYPPSRRKGGHLVEVAFLDQCHSAGGPSVLMAALANHQASEQWGNPALIPAMDKWLTEERWRQELPVAGAVSSSASNPKTAGNVAALQRFVDRGRTA